MMAVCERPSRSLACQSSVFCQAMLASLWVVNLDLARCKYASARARHGVLCVCVFQLQAGFLDEQPIDGFPSVDTVGIIAADVSAQPSH